MRMSEAVSYTHLDVYKRQCLGYVTPGHVTISVNKLIFALCL